MYCESLENAIAVTDLDPLGNLKFPLHSAVWESQMKIKG